MSLEKSISDLAAAINALASALTNHGAIAPAAQAPAPAPVPTMPEPVPSAPVPVAPGPLTLVPAPAPAPAPAIPGLMPPFAPAPAPAPAAPVNVPFVDTAGLVKWLTALYNDLGAAKGVKIQGVLTRLGYNDVNKIEPKDFAAFYTQCEALRG